MVMNWTRETHCWLLMAGLPRIVVVGFSLRLAAVLRFRTKGLVWGDPEAMVLVVAKKTCPESKYEN